MYIEIERESEREQTCGIDWKEWEKFWCVGWGERRKKIRRRKMKRRRRGTIPTRCESEKKGNFRREPYS